MKEHVPVGTLHCYWSDLKQHPKCIHGPALLFGRQSDGEITKFYACSACRDRKICSFYSEYGKKVTKQQEQNLEKERKKNLPFYNHQKLFIQFNKLLSENSTMRAYCYTCEKLLLVSDKFKHNDHEIIENLSDYQMLHPTEILKPLENSRKEAQYLFSKKAVKDIVNLLESLNAKSVLCIGTPRIHEHITQNLVGKISSLLLDIDGRFNNFFGPLSYCWYNLFNHYFFQKNSEDIFKEFLSQNEGKDMYLICDPPFGGRVEPISQTIKTISDLHKKLNKISCSENELKIIFIFPYFMEAIMKNKSNPSNISGGLKDLNMTDYKVDYDNHPLFVSKLNNEKQGSQVRIYTNIPLNLIKLPESDGYKYCKRCDKWIAPENKHCKLCKKCTSKDGRRYRHCKVCKFCVKPTWQHCKTCNRCALPNHLCGQKPKIGNCFKCNEIGHTEKECPTIQDMEKPITIIKAKKRSNKTNNNDFSTKKQKVNSSLGDSQIIKKTNKKLIKKSNMKKQKIEKVSDKIEKKLPLILKQKKKKDKISKSGNVLIVSNEKPKQYIEKENSDISEAKSKKVKSDKRNKNRTNKVKILETLISSTKNSNGSDKNIKILKTKLQRKKSK